MREPLTLRLKMAVTPRYLASGDSYPTLQYAFRVARLTINKFVMQVCDAIIRAYQDEVMTCPTCPEDWLEVELVFLWNSQHAMGSVNGKYIPIRCPQLRGFHSIVPLALVDGNYKFLSGDFEEAVSSSDAQIFAHQTLTNVSLPKEQYGFEPQSVQLQTQPGKKSG